MNLSIQLIRSRAISLLFAFTVGAEKIAILQLGTNIILGNAEFRASTSLQNYDVAPVGLSGGVLLPVKFPVVDVYYKVRVAYHPATRHDTDVILLRSYEVNTHYLSALNAVAAGRTFRLGQTPLSLQPLCGLGMSVETTYKNYGKGVVYELVFFDISTVLKYSFRTFGTGILAEFQHGFFSSNDEYRARNKLNVSLIFSM